MVSNPALHSPHSLSFQEAVKGRLKFDAALYRKLQMAVEEGVRTDHKFMGQDLQHPHQHRRENADAVHPRADSEANPRCGPESGGGGQALDGAAMFKDDSSA